MGRRKSLEVNMLLNSVNAMLRIIFPLITFPYASKVLGVENIAIYSFSSSFIGYFVLVAGLGISGYAVREGAKLREDKDRFAKFADSVFTINILSTAVSYILLVLCCVFFDQLREYIPVIAVISANIAFCTLGVEWIYSAQEDYTYITVRNIIVRLISIVLLFVFVKNDNDLLLYAGVSAFFSVGTGVANYICAKKYYRPKFVLDLKQIEFKKHIVPILVMFAMSVSATIYVNSDVTILGIVWGDYTVGIYSVATKIYDTIKTILSAVIIAAIPHLSARIGEGDLTGFTDKAREVYFLLITFLLPAIVGIAVLRKELVILISDITYIEAATSLVILCGALLFSICGWFWGHCVLIPFGKEKTVFYALATAAGVNILLNLFLVPIWQEKAAAVTTLVAELIQCGLTVWAAKKYLSATGAGICAVKSAVGCAGIVAVNMIIKIWQFGCILHTITVVVLSVVVYITIEVMLKNSTVINILKKAAKR